jgi:hypothetical protein
MRNTLGGSVGFPIDIEGVVPLASDEPASLDSLAVRTERSLVAGRATEVSRVGTTVNVRIGALDMRLNGFDVLGSVDDGTVEVIAGPPKTLVYRFSMRRSFMVSVIGGAAVGIGMFVFSGFPLLLNVVAVLSFLALDAVGYTVNYFVTGQRLPGLFDDVPS